MLRNLQAELKKYLKGCILFCICKANKKEVIVKSLLLWYNM